MRHPAAQAIPVSQSSVEARGRSPPVRVSNRNRRLCRPGPAGTRLRGDTRAVWDRESTGGKGVVACKTEPGQPPARLGPGGPLWGNPIMLAHSGCLSGLAHPLGQAWV